mgnify:CR=1 FL=1
MGNEDPLGMQEIEFSYTFRATYGEIYFSGEEMVQLIDDISFKFSI